MYQVKCHTYLNKTALESLQWTPGVKELMKTAMVDTYLDDHILIDYIFYVKPFKFKILKCTTQRTLCNICRCSSR